MNTSHETPQAAARRLAAGAMRDGFTFEALHTYTDCVGNPLYHRIRLKNTTTGEKWIRPMKMNGMGYVLGEPPAEEHPDGKPLYRLHDLAARPNEEVIVTEGEKKADKLAELGLLVTTSGAADSARKADWRPLVGHDVRIWPDHDDAGRRYADAAVAALTALGCTVRVVDVASLGLEAKGDAADWLDAHPQATKADVLSLACLQGPEIEPQREEEGAEASAPSRRETEAPADGDAPNTCKYGDGMFTLSEAGVFFTGAEKGRPQYGYVPPRCNRQDAGHQEQGMGPLAGMVRRRRCTAPVGDAA